jgi:hypothetical protein
VGKSAWRPLIDSAGTAAEPHALDPLQERIAKNADLLWNWSSCVVGVGARPAVTGLLSPHRRLKASACHDN